MLEEFLSPLLSVLDALLDKRLVRTVVQWCVAIMRFRNNTQGLLLSELGSSRDGERGVAATATAGTKRRSHLLRAIKWSILHSDRYLRAEADKEVKTLHEQGKRIVCIWDGRVREQPESSKREGWCPVVSSQAKRLNRSRKGRVFTFPPRKPVSVTRMQWTGALITAMAGMLKVALMSWWSTQGEQATRLRTQAEALLRTGVRQWGDLLLHIFDRGSASGPGIQLLQGLKVRFVSRWKKGHCFFEAKGEEKQ